MLLNLDEKVLQLERHDYYMLYGLLRKNVSWVWTFSFIDETVSELMRGDRCSLNPLRVNNQLPRILIAGMAIDVGSLTEHML